MKEITGQEKSVWEEKGMPEGMRGSQRKQADLDLEKISTVLYTFSEMQGVFRDPLDALCPALSGLARLQISQAHVIIPEVLPWTSWHQLPPSILLFLVFFFLRSFWDSSADNWEVI